MPGIITHSLVFLESINYLRREKIRTHLYRSIETLFSDSDFLKAGLFGSIGPDIFDFQPFRRCAPFGSDLSFRIHNGGSAKLLSTMLDRVLSMGDFNNEWSGSQRAYLYGFISHIIADCFFNPFIYYWSGFPVSRDRKEVAHFREQNLMLEYNIDLFFSYNFREERFNPVIQDLFPLRRRGRLAEIEPAVKEMLFGSLRDIYPEFYKKFLWIKGRRNGALVQDSLGYIDISLYLVRLAYWLKRTNNRRLVSMINRLRRRKNIFYSDLLVRYPEPRKINTHILNLHRERWFNPAGASGLHYESVEDLLKTSCETVAVIWQQIEGILYGSRRGYESVVKKLSLNAITGTRDSGARALKIKNPVTLRF